MTVIIRNTKVVLRSLFIGLKYSKIVGEIEAHNQSIKRPNKFQNKIITKNHHIRGKKLLAKSLSL